MRGQACFRAKTSFRRRLRLFTFQMDALNLRWVKYNEGLAEKKEKLQNIKEAGQCFANKQRDVKYAVEKCLLKKKMCKLGIRFTTFSLFQLQAYDSLSFQATPPCSLRGC